MGNTLPESKLVVRLGWAAGGLALASSPAVVFPMTDEVNEPGSVDCEKTEDQLKVKVTISMPIVQRMLMGYQVK